MKSLSGWWHGLPAALRHPWPPLFAAAVILVQLAGFHHVVRESVRHGDAQRVAFSARPAVRTPAATPPHNTAALAQR